MNKTRFSEKCSILGDLWLYYREDAARNETWGNFFMYNDVALPLAYMISQDLALVSGDGRAEEYIDETWDMFCEFIEIDPDGWYQNINEAFDASPRPVLEDDDE